MNLMCCWDTNTATGAGLAGDTTQRPLYDVVHHLAGFHKVDGGVKGRYDNCLGGLCDYAC